jgi:outer membrane protein assembly factor BamB
MKFTSTLRLALFVPLLAGAMAAAPVLAKGATVKLSTTVDHPKANVLVGGLGFAPNEAVDIYFDTTDMVLAFTDGNGKFSNRKLQVPADALPGEHWITAVGRTNGDGNQKSFTVRTDWAEFGFTERGRRVNPYENVIDASNAGSLDLAWTASLNASTASCPAVKDGTAYISANDAKLYAVDVATGAVKWTAPTNGAAYSCPAAADGVVYVGSGDGELHAFDAATGAVKWTGPAGNFIYASPAVANGIVYIGSLDGKLYAFRAADGALLWTATTGNQIYASPTVANGFVYVGSNDTTVYAFDAVTGVSLWTTVTCGSVLFSAVASGVVYAGCANSNSDKQIYALNASTGATLWTTSVGSGPGGSPAIVNGTMYIGSLDGNVYALNAATGAKKWTAAGINPTLSSPAVANGVVYAGSSGGRIYALNSASGAVLWSAVIDDTGYASPAIADGVLYTGSYNGRLYAFALDGGRNRAYRRRATPPSYATLHPNLHLKPTH